MKIYKYYYLLFSMLVLTMAGCASDGINEKTDATTVSPVNESKEAKINDDIYSNILNQYNDVINNDFFHDVLSGESKDWDSIGKDVNENLLNNARFYENFKIYYALKDINGDEIPDLFIGGSGDNEAPIIYDMFIINQNKAINPFTELGYVFGHRIQLYVFKGGIFEVDWSTSGMNNGMDFYKISEKGSLDLIESVSLKPANSDPNEPPRYFHDNESNTEISEKEFDSIVQQFRDLDKEELPWVEINGNQ